MGMLNPWLKMAENSEPVIHKFIHGDAASVTPMSINAALPWVNFVDNWRVHDSIVPMECLPMVSSDGVF